MKTVQELRIKILKLHTKIYAVQAVCTHEGLTKTAGASTGGYDGPAFDRYWYDFSCPICEKRWTEDQ